MIKIISKYGRWLIKLWLFYEIYDFSFFLTYLSGWEDVFQEQRKKRENSCNHTKKMINLLNEANLYYDIKYEKRENIKSNIKSNLKKRNLKIAMTDGFLITSSFNLFLSKCNVVANTMYPTNIYIYMIFYHPSYHLYLTHKLIVRTDL